MTMRITVLGTDYEGLTISVGLATLGHTVTTVDTNHSRARRLHRGQSIGDDADLSRQMKRVLREGQLKITSEPENCLAEADVVIIAGVPGSDPDRIPDRSQILRTAECLSGAIASFSTVIVTARIPTGSCRLLQDWLNNAMFTGAVNVVAFPVFFSQPQGLQSFLHPDRIILGYENEKTRRVLDELFANLILNETSLFHVSWEAAEMMRNTGGTLSAGIPGEPESTEAPSIEAVEKTYSRIGQRR